MIYKGVHSGRLERWLGIDTIERIQRDMKGWYGPPIHLLDVPGSVRITKDGDFIGPFEHGYFASAKDVLFSRMKNVIFKPKFDAHKFGAFASISDALSEMSGGKRQALNYGSIQKVGTAAGAIGGAVSLWYPGTMPAAGTVGTAAPGGVALTKANTGALAFTNPSGGDTTHLVGADVSASVVNTSLLLYDRLYSVTKTMASTATEAVTGVPTRYQSTTAGDPDYIGGNFLTIECRTVLPATAHNWTTCTYVDQDNSAATLPSVTGISSCAANRVDISVGWFAPLVSGGTGIKNLTQMQCSASVATGAIDFTIGHPIGFMTFPVANMIFPFDWLTNRDLAPRIFDDACLALMQMPQPASSACTFSGNIYIGQG